MHELAHQIYIYIPQKKSGLLFFWISKFILYNFNPNLAFGCFKFIENSKLIVIGWFGNDLFEGKVGESRPGVDRVVTYIKRLRLDPLLLWAPHIQAL